MCRVHKNGALVVKDDAGVRKSLAPSQRLFNRGYAVTSYASQGKTVDTVLFADASNRAATNCNQWYVAISRGRKRVLVFTSDKEALRASIRHTGDRELALELNPVVTEAAETPCQQIGLVLPWAQAHRPRFIQNFHSQNEQTTKMRI